MMSSEDDMIRVLVWFQREAAWEAAASDQNMSSLWNSHTPTSRILLRSSTKDSTFRRRF